MTIEQVFFISRDEFQKLVGTTDDIFISIYGHDYPEKHQAIPNGRWKDGIFLQFDDVDCDDSDTAFNESMAANVLSFIDKHHRESYMVNLIVHCYAGISRSAAIAKFVNEHFSLKRNHALTYYTLFNKYVYRTIHKKHLNRLTEKLDMAEAT